MDDGERMMARVKRAQPDTRTVAKDESNQRGAAFTPLHRPLRCDSTCSKPDLPAWVEAA
jgi:hypothetical protein